MLQVAVLRFNRMAVNPDSDAHLRANQKPRRIRQAKAQPRKPWGAVVDWRAGR